MLSSDQKCPANAVMAPQTQDVFWTSYLRSIYVLCLRGEDYYFAETGSKRYRGWPRTTIVSTFQDEIKLTLEKKPSFSVKGLLIYNVFASSVKIEFCGEILLLTFTRLLKTRTTTACFQIESAIKKMMKKRMVF